MAKQSNVRSRRKLLTPIFHHQTEKDDDKVITPGIIKIVRKTGQLNLSGRSLINVPQRIFLIYDLSPEEKSSGMEFSHEKEEDENWWNFKPLTYLDLSSNIIQEIPKDIGLFEDLTVLNLQDNKLTSLPPQIGKLTKLTKLNLNRNKINQLPQEFYNLIELQSLSIANNCLECVDRDLSNLIMLQQMDFSNNFLSDLPPGLGFLVRLREINFSHNQLTELPPDIVNLRALLKLDVTDNELEALPKMGEFKRLQFFYAQHNNIKEIPDFEGCEHLQQIYFGNNYIKEIPVEFCESLPHIKILDLRDNKIESLPDEIAMLQQLIRLDLTNNDLSNLPNSLGLLPHLQNLQLEGNKLKQVRPDIVKSGTIRILKFLREKIDSESLDIQRNAPNLPFEPKLYPDKWAMRNSKTLSLTMKELTKIPHEVFEDAQWGEVTVVDLCKNKITEVPPSLELLSEFVGELNLSKNQIGQIPEFLGKFQRLQYLDLGNNCLDNLPKNLGDLPYIRELVLSNNRFISIPNCVYEMQSLEILLVNDNKLNEINVEGLKKLERIATLDLSNNNIAQVPPELGNLTQLRCLELKGNCFRQPRWAILEQGTETILQYLRDKIAK